MLVDDEQMVLDDLQSIVDWESKGFSIVATAKNGKQALKKYRESSPRVIFTDIRMPLIDGVQLAKELRSLGENPVIIFLTAYQDFSYAKQAFLYGIDDYLLKNEVDEKNLSERLEKLRARIELEKHMTGFLNRKLVLNLLKQPGQAVPGALAEQGLFSKKLLHCFLEEDNPCPFFSQTEKNRPKQVMEYIEQDFRAKLGTFPVFVFTEIEYGRGLISIGLQQNLPLETEVRLFCFKIEEVQAALKNRSGKSFTAILVQRPTALPALHEFYRRIDHIFQAKYFSGHGRIYTYDAPELVCGGGQRLFALDRIYAAVNIRDKEKVTRLIQGIYEKIIADRRYEELVSISNILYQLLKNLSFEKDQYSSVDIRPEKNQQHWYQAEDIKQWMVEKFTQVIQMSGTVDKRNLSQPVKRAPAFIEEQYGSSALKIDAIAAYAGLSPSRLSVLFKAEVGDTVNEYLTAYRIMQAQFLLKEGAYKIYEVAERVGYGSSQYFSQIFYQRVGVTPKDFCQRVPRHE